MKALKFSISVFLALTVASSAFAGDPKIVQRYMGLGIGAEKAKALATPISVGLTVTNVNLTPVAGVTPASGNASFGSTTVKGLTVTKTDGTPVAGITPASGNFNTAGNIQSEKQVAGSTGWFSGNMLVGSLTLMETPLPILTPGAAFPTPATGVTLSARWSRVVAGAPTANFLQLPVATANVQKDYGVINESANPVAIVAQGADTANAATANTPYVCAATKRCDCKGTSTTTFQCVGM